MTLRATVIHVSDILTLNYDTSYFDTLTLNFYRNETVAVVPRHPRDTSVILSRVNLFPL